MIALKKSFEVQNYLKKLSDEIIVILGYPANIIENFAIEEVEKCEDSILSERERYWIEYFGSFKNGYNATIGGDGIPYIDYNLVIATYRNIQNQNKTAEILGIDPKTVVRILTIRNEDICDKHLVNKQDYGKVVNMYDMNGTYEKNFYDR